MLTGVQIAVIGGDARQLEVIRKLIELDAKLSLIGFEQLDQAFTGAVKEKIDEVDFENKDSLILPVPGTSLDGQIETIFSNEKVYLRKEMLLKTPSHCTVYSGITNSYLDSITKQSNRRLVKLFERDDVAIYNSIPTVEGTIMMAIQHTDITIHGSQVTVLGLGRVGMSVARTFAALGAKVKVGARRSEHLARITEMGLIPFHLDDLVNQIKDADICINTIPYLVVTASVISKMPVHTLIIDLASKPGGTDFRYAEKGGVKALLAPGLPGIVAPKTAGQILANVLSQLITDNMKSEGEINMSLKGKRIGFGLTGSHCTYDDVFPEIEKLVNAGVEVLPVVTFTVKNTETRFGKGEDWVQRIEDLTGKKVIDSIVKAEPLGPKIPLNCMIIAPLTGNSLSKFANAMTDSPVLMAAKATLRNGKPVVLGISTNDALGLNGVNLMRLMATKNIYFIPYGQDDPIKKPNSMVARMTSLSETVEEALLGKQYQPVIIEKYKDNH